MSNAGKAALPKLNTITPHIVCANAAAAIDFYKTAFGAEEVMRLEAPDGTFMHGSLRIGNGYVMLAEENPKWGSLGPKTLNGTPVTIHLSIDDVDGVFNRAVAAGAEIKMSPADMFWGDRYGVVKDPFGHTWSIATHVRDMTLDEIKAEMMKMPPMDGGPDCAGKTKAATAEPAKGKGKTKAKAKA